MQYTQVRENQSLRPALSAGGGVFYLLCKRLGDILFAVVGGILLALPMAVIALLIRLDSPGPALFRQERLGLNGQPFMMVKFRSMRLDAEADGPQWARPNDSRCTRLGAFLRKCRLDELPQLWNILKGEMSVVGPRPERPCFYAEFERYIPGFWRRLAVKPGLTGYAQVNGGYDLGPEEKLAYDLEYMARRTALLDLWCVVRTVGLILTHEGAR